MKDPSSRQSRSKGGGIAGAGCEARCPRQGNSGNNPSRRTRPKPIQGRAAARRWMFTSWRASGGFLAAPWGWPSRGGARRPVCHDATFVLYRKKHVLEEDKNPKFTHGNRVRVRSLPISTDHQIALPSTTGQPPHAPVAAFSRNGRMDWYELS
jgi:hypothetical protein